MMKHNDEFEKLLNSIDTSGNQVGWVSKLLPFENNKRIYAAYKLPEKLISLIVEVPTNYVNFENQFESRGFSVLHKKKDNDKEITQVIICLNDNEYKEVFLEITELFIHRIGGIENDKDLYNMLIERIEIYSNFFDKQHKQGLLINAQQGLFAELEIMEKFFFKNFGFPKSLEMWHAPDSGLHDFTFKGVSLEIKSTHKFPAQDVSISSEFQLNDKRVTNLYLAVFEIIRGSTQGESLKEKVEKIRDRIASSDSQFIHKFNELLNKYGYYDSHSAGYYTSFKTNLIYYYIVEGDFPRILPKRLLDGVGGVRYKIDLNKCTRWLTELDQVKDSFTNVISAGN